MDIRPLDPARALRDVFLRDMVLQARIGVHPHEHHAPQRVRINLQLAVEDDSAQPMSRPGVGRDDLARVVDYEHLAGVVRREVSAGHTRLVETLAERIAEAAMADPRVSIVRVTVEKLDVFPDAASAGVSVLRRRR